MSTVARRIAASPKRTATEVWDVISQMLCEKSSDAEKALVSATGVIAGVISEEIPRDTPFVITGSGPRVKIYCQYGEDALDSECCNETPLAQKPMINEWKLYVPCASEDLEWLSLALKNISSSVIAYDKTAEPDIPVEKTYDQKGLTLNKENFLTKL